MLHNKDKFLLIAGPCALENENICRTVADTLARFRDETSSVIVIFKGSFDKANRTSFRSKRGPGLKEGLALLKMVKEEYGFPVVTDVHLPEQAQEVAEVCDVLQIPAFLCRQTDLLVAAAETGRVVEVKKGQFLSPQEMAFATKKLEESGAKEIWQIERGTFFGYQNLVVDMRSIGIMKAHGHPVIFDVTHSVQLPGASGGKSGGQREFILPLAYAACAAGIDGLFLETHPRPNEAISDAQSQLPLDELEALVKGCMRHWAIRASADFSQLREKEGVINSTG